MAPGEATFEFRAAMCIERGKQNGGAEEVSNHMTGRHLEQFCQQRKLARRVILGLYLLT